MAILIPSTPPCSKSIVDLLVQLLESALMDLVSLGLLSEEKIHSFNLPLYHPTLAEMEALVKRNGHFNIERMNPLVRLPPRGI
ncbi:loganic acid O-methyltransferase-like [Eucalyptus grandis]|uniref:loganic acid O-methyltransferase-like n=1 Tax=Eucalyptus grandis TaxID=71139 RepID=UPI00192EE266|nr:loganic acid O-methyltransferase-like [Eucalyptus grandis]